MKFAVLVGINQYPQSPLQGCVNDVLDYQATLAAKGFSYAVLTDNMATKANIIANLNSMINAAHANDALVFAYSGHGSQVRDTNADEADGLDEVLCPVDFFNGQYISDDDLRGIFSRLPANVSCDVFLDSCHSGTATRDVSGAIRYKFIPSGLKATKIRKKAVVLVPTLNHCLAAGCRDNQTSAEVSIGGKPRGAFSYYILKAIRANYTRANAVAYAEQKILALGLNQNPQLEATQSESVQLPFT